ncbi:hypothetical protein HYR99_08250 [Candidatus Poribacteria bacterium]|nr:hypothetical protein [Candidatus Poribacteria bacterium]
MAQEKTNDEPESGFAILSEMVRLDVSFTAIGNLSIMSGSGDGILDNTVQRTGSEPHDFAITGSTLKGVTRSTIEAILAGCEDVCAPMACAPKGETIKGRLSDCGEVIRIAKREKKPIPQDVPCSICQMFGSTSQKGRVVFHDAPIQTQEKAIQRTHVAIDRETGTASPRALTTIETIPRGPEFVGSVGFTNPEDWMIGAMIYVLV